MQDALNKRIGVSLPPPTDEEKAKWILNYTRAMQQETAELIDSVPWKWWAKYQKFDEQNAKVEVVDLFHFLVSLAQTLGMTPDDVYQAYLKKNAVNHQRQESGYVKKDEADSKHIWIGFQPSGDQRSTAPPDTRHKRMRIFLMANPLDSYLHRHRHEAAG